VVSLAEWTTSRGYALQAYQMAALRTAGSTRYQQVACSVYNLESNCPILLGQKTKAHTYADAGTEKSNGGCK
jgi:hypothetical protein